jgi:threonine/homoserine/homoserine lactone efflux protein
LLTAFFLLICVLSAVGSLQPGLVNVAVVQVGLRRGLAPSLWLAAGGSLPEVLYAWLALRVHLGLDGWLASFVLRSPLAPWLAVGALALGGGYYLYRARRPSVPAPATDTGAAKPWAPLAQGLGLALQNAQLVVFWLAVLAYLPRAPRLVSPVQLASPAYQYAFVLGSGLGAFAFLAGLAWLTARLGPRLGQNFGQRASYWSGWLLLLLAAWGAWQAVG